MDPPLLPVSIPNPELPPVLESIVATALDGQQPESKSRLKHFHLWKPNIMNDHHEMGSTSTYFFQPGIVNQQNPLTP